MELGELKYGKWFAASARKKITGEKVKERTTNPTERMRTINTWRNGYLSAHFRIGPSGINLGDAI